MRRLSARANAPTRGTLRAAALPLNISERARQPRTVADSVTWARRSQSLTHRCRMATSVARCTHGWCKLWRQQTRQRLGMMFGTRVGVCGREGFRIVEGGATEGIRPHAAALQRLAVCARFCVPHTGGSDIAHWRYERVPYDGHAVWSVLPCTCCRVSTVYGCGT